MVIGDDITDLVPCRLVNDDQVTRLVERFHAVPVDDDIRNLSAELHGCKDDPGSCHSHQEKGGGNSIDPAGESVHDLILIKGRDHGCGTAPFIILLMCPDGVKVSSQ